MTPAVWIGWKTMKLSQKGHFNTFMPFIESFDYVIVRYLLLDWKSLDITRDRRAALSDE